MTRLTIVGGLMVLGFSAGCGSATDTTGGSVIMNGGGGSGGGTAGTGFTPFGSGGGGSGGTAGAAMGGSGGSAGTTAIAGSGGSLGTGASSGAGAGGSGGQAPTGVPGYPSGPVFMCFGKGCPLGECDNDKFFAPTACSAVYTSDIGPSSSYCNAAETDTYCIEVGTDFDPDFSVSCVNGAATVMKCNGGCGSFGTAAYECLSF